MEAMKGIDLFVILVALYNGLLFICAISADEPYGSLLLETGSLRPSA
jgi:hypothetical protein